MCGIKTIVTTVGRPNQHSFELAEKACKALELPFIERKKKSLQKIAEEHHANLIVAGKLSYEYLPFESEEPFFFHPSSAAFRLKRIARGEHEPFLDVAKLQNGDTFLDCTLGLGSDSIVAAYAVGDIGLVIGCEGNPNVAFIVREGMRSYDRAQLPLLSCMDHIQVVSSLAIDYLKQQQDNAFDVVYMDPMFEETIEESKNFSPLRVAGLQNSLTDEWVEEAKRVAKKRIVLKAHFRSPLFDQYHFTRDIRYNAKFHYGVIEL